MEQLQSLFTRLQAPRDRMEMAYILVELADLAENKPILQDFLKKTALPPPYDVMEYIRPGGRRRGYWGRKSFRRENPSELQIQARLEFSKINYSLFGTKGAVERPDGTRIGLVNYMAGEMMRGKKSVDDTEKDKRRRQKAVERLTLSY